jgi:LPXTG-motif cell wall-anchored protein
MRSSFHSSFGAARRVVPFAAVDPSIISSAISAGGAIATTAISASASAKAAKAKKPKKKKRAASDEAPPETGATTQPATGGVPSWALYAGLGLLVLVGGFLVLRKSNAKAAR